MLLLLLACRPETTGTPDPDPTATTGPTADTGLDPGIPFFEPDLLEVDAFYAYDPDTDALHPFTDAGGTRDPFLAVYLHDATELPSGEVVVIDTCVWRAWPTDPSSIQRETWTFRNTYDTPQTDHVHHGFHFPPGSLDWDFPDLTTGIRGCDEKRFDPERFPDLGGQLASIPWGFSFGTVDAYLVATLEGMAPADGSATDILGRIDGGTVVGGGHSWGHPVDSDEVIWPTQYATAYAVDDDWTVLDPAVPLTAEQMLPPSGLPARGHYTLQSYPFLYYAVDALAAATAR